MTPALQQQACESKPELLAVLRALTRRGVPVTSILVTPTHVSRPTGTGQRVIAWLVVWTEGTA